MNVKSSKQRDQLIGRITEYLADGGALHPDLTKHEFLYSLFSDIREHLLTQTYWPQGIGKPKRDYSGDWKRRLR